MENREPQNRFLQPLKDSERHGARNSRVFLKAKVIQASSQLNPDRDKYFSVFWTIIIKSEFRSS